MRELVLVGVSHRTSGIELRERLALATTDTTSALRDFLTVASLDEALVLSTCGRTEVYGLTNDAAEAEEALLAAMAARADLPLERFALQAHVARGAEAVHHLFRVAAGLDSMVLGEAEILGQLRRARNVARAAGAVSHTTSGLVDRARRAGAAAREQTGIGTGRVSLASVAAELVQRHLPDGGGRALVIGSGDTGTKTARALQTAGMELTIVAGRSWERARSLAADVGGRAVELDGGLFDPLVETDVVVSCTAAPRQLVSFELLADVMAHRGGRPLLVLDLALPRDVDPRAHRLDGLDLHDLDDLATAARSAANRRAAAVPAAEALVQREAERCARWLAGLHVVATIKGLQRTSEDAVLTALRRTELGAQADEALLRRASQTIVARLLHQPALTLRDAAARNESDRLVQSVRELFALGAAA